MAKIAVVDDSRLVRKMVIATLQKAGHETLDIEPLSLFEVLSQLRKEKPQVVLTDFLMPGCPGISLVRACREDPGLKDTWIVVITAHHDEEVQTRLERMGNVSFLHKPFEPQALLKEVADRLETQG